MFTHLLSSSPYHLIPTSFHTLFRLFLLSFPTTPYHFPSKLLIQTQLSSTQPSPFQPFRLFLLFKTKIYLIPHTNSTPTPKFFQVPTLTVTLGYFNSKSSCWLAFILSPASEAHVDTFRSWNSGNHRAPSAARQGTTRSC